MADRRLQGPTAAIGAALIAVAMSGCAGGGLGGAAGSCAGPTIELGESSLQPGGVVQLTADFVWETCEDTGGTSRAASDVTVTVTPTATGEEIVLGRPEPGGERSSVSGSFDLPGDLPVGDAVLGVRTHTGDRISAELPITIEAAPASPPAVGPDAAVRPGPIGEPSLMPLDRVGGPALAFGAAVDEDHDEVVIVVAGSTDCNAVPGPLEAGDPAGLDMELLGAGQEYCVQNAVHTTYRFPIPDDLPLVPGDRLRVGDYGEVVLQSVTSPE